MGMPIVIVASGGLPITEATNGYGTPVSVATNGYGTPCTIVASGGMPVVGSGGGALQFVATGGELPSNVGTLSTSLGQTARFQGSTRNQIGYGGAKFIKLVLPTFYWDGSTEKTLTSPIPVQCSLLFPNAPGTKEVQFAWGGNTQGSIPASATVGEYISDQINPSAFGYGSLFPANTVFYFKFLYDCAVGVANFSGVGRDVIDPDCFCYYGTAAAYTSQMGNGLTVISTGATGTGNSANPPAWTLKPWALIGAPGVPTISVLSIGDSIFQGQLGSAYPNLGGGGYLANSFMNANGHVIPWASNAKFGTTAAGYQANANLMKATYKYATHALSNYGTNGATAAAELTALQSIWPDLKGHTGSTIKRVEQTLILPRDSSTDLWATL